MEKERASRVVPEFDIDIREKAAEELLDHCTNVNLKTNETISCGLAALLKLTLHSKNLCWDISLLMISFWLISTHLEHYRGHIGLS